MASKTFDEILAALITDIQNNCPGADVTVGSPLFADAAATASAIWGLQAKLDYNARQSFPYTADSSRLERWCYLYNITRETDETDSELLTRLLSRMQQAPAGGNAADYVTWAKAVTGVASAKCISCPQGAGTVDIVILADETSTGSETPTTELIAAVYEYIDSVRPVTAGTFRVLAAQIIEQDITMSVSGTVTASAVTEDIEVLMTGLKIGETLYLAKLVNLAIIDGSADAVISAPASNVVPTDYQVVRPGTVTVS